MPAPAASPALLRAAGADFFAARTAMANRPATESIVIPAYEAELLAMSAELRFLSYRAPRHGAPDRRTRERLRYPAHRAATVAVDLTAAGEAIDARLPVRGPGTVMAPGPRRGAARRCRPPATAGSPAQSVPERRAENRGRCPGCYTPAQPQRRD